MAVTYKGAGTWEVDPISRIEGHLGVKLTTDAGGFVTDANVHGNLWRGFENFLIGRNPNDAITFTQRICGVCPVPHGTTSLFAVEAAYGYSDGFQTFSTISGYGGGANPKTGVPPKALYIRNLVLGAEFLMSSITHFYHLAAPSYVQGPNVAPWTPYFANTYYHPLLLSAGGGTDQVGVIDTTSGGIVAPINFTTSGFSTQVSGSTLPTEGVNGFSSSLWSAVIKQYVKALRIRRLTFEAGAMFAGRMPMTSAWIAGGVATDHTEDLTLKCTKFHDMIQEVGVFVASEYVPLLLALGALYPNFDNFTNASILNTNASGLWQMAGFKNDVETPTSGLGGNTAWGAGVGNFISWGGFPNTDGTLSLGRKWLLADGSSGTITTTNVTDNLREHLLYSRYDYTSSGALAAGYASGGISDPAVVTRTIPKRTDTSQYSWLKAPRWNTTTGTPTWNAMEVGPLATMMIAGVWQKGVALSSTIPGFSAYLKSVSGTPSGTISGLDPAMIAPDLAVALVRTGLCYLNMNGTPVNAAGLNAVPASGVAGAYYAATSVITDGDYPLVTYIASIVGGISTIDRLRGRAVQSLVLVQSMLGAMSKSSTSPTFPALDTTGAGARPAPSAGWLQQLMWESKSPSGIAATYDGSLAPPTAKSFGIGATEAPRGALMHMCTVEAGVISAYQCIVPTTWNAGPKDVLGNHGPMETSMLGVPYSATKTYVKTTNSTDITAGGGVEALRVAQSFDPCIACAVH